MGLGDEIEEILISRADPRIQDTGPYLLEWYAREGFAIREPIEGDTFPTRHVARIEMHFE